MYTDSFTLTAICSCFRTFCYETFRKLFGNSPWWDALWVTLQVEGQQIYKK